MAPGGLSESSQGIFFIVTNGALQVALQSLAQYLKSKQWPYCTMLSAACLITSVLLALLAAAARAPLPPSSRAGWLLFRGVVASLRVALGIIAAILGTPLGDVAALTSIDNVVAAVLGWCVVGERLGWVHLVAVPCTTIGAVLITRPGWIFKGEEMSLRLTMGYLTALGTGATQGCQFVAGRKLKGVPESYQSSITCLFIVPPMVLCAVVLFPEADLLSRITSEPGQSVEWLTTITATVTVATLAGAMGATRLPAAVSATLSLAVRIVCGFAVQLWLGGARLTPLSVAGAALMLTSSTFLVWWKAAGTADAAGGGRPEAKAGADMPSVAACSAGGEDEETGNKQMEVDGSLQDKNEACKL